MKSPNCSACLRNGDPHAVGLPMGYRRLVLGMLFLAGLTLPVYLAAVPRFVGTSKLGQQLPLLGKNNRAKLIHVYVGW